MTPCIQKRVVTSGADPEIFKGDGGGGGEEKEKDGVEVKKLGNIAC